MKPTKVTASEVASNIVRAHLQAAEQANQASIDEEGCGAFFAAAKKHRADCTDWRGRVYDEPLPEHLRRDQ